MYIVLLPEGEGTLLIITAFIAALKTTRNTRHYKKYAG
jgi:hypothetical protein